MIDLDVFFQNQLNDWELAKVNYSQLDAVEVKKCLFDGFDVYVQYNPGRMISSSARVDRQSIEDRPCFLCESNRPQEQQSIVYHDSYDILVNPYPIFNPHFTIAEKRHLPQELSGKRLEDMLDLAKDMPEYTLLYNGAKAGASAPDHFHFQAIKRGILPIESDVFRMTDIDNYLRTCVVVQGSDKSDIIERVGIPGQMVNIVCWYEGDSWTMVAFPRRQHRPMQYYETGENQVLISPGVIDFAGVFITPRKEDFDKMSSELIKDIYKQLSL